ncbi:protein kinase domain-containing protein [Streptomyces boninensis]|uniref:protein kinase domain-containing protein n=1 Tax=Streptomyces boninensis TaxID=2039455 RepID=UPI003B2271D8
MHEPYGHQAAAGSWQVGDVIAGRYEVLHRHEQGGMGVVHRVRHREWGIHLAVKSPRQELLASPGFLERFVAEAEHWVGLGLHPHVCGCHYVRVMDGVPRVFAEYIGGGSLAEWIADGRLYAGGSGAALARMLDVAVQLAWGLEHAHGRGLVHQDVKPANALIDGDGSVKVTDFGLARGAGGGGGGGGGVAGTDPRPGRSVLVTRGGMTVPYASPEQLAGERVGRRTDVFSYGVSVLEMFTRGVTWMAGPAAGAALVAYREDGGSSDAEGVPDMPDELADLLARCLADGPRERPGSLAECARELVEIYGRSTGAAYPRPAPAEADLRADGYGNRALSLLDLGRVAEAEEAFAAALAADPRHLPTTYNRALHRWRSGAITDAEAVAAVASLQSEPADWEVRSLLAQLHLERGDRDHARHLLKEMERDRPADDAAEPVRDALASGRGAEARRLESRPLPWAGGAAARPASSRTTFRTSADATLALSGGEQEPLLVWDLQAGACRDTLTRHRAKVAAFDVSADGRFAVSVDEDSVLCCWDLAAGRNLGTMLPRGASSRDRWRSLRLSADGRIAAGVFNGRLAAWDFPTGRRRRFTEAATDKVTRIEISADGRRAVTSAGAIDRTIRVWDLDGEKLLWTMPDTTYVTSVCLSADGRLAAIATTEGLRYAIQLWEVDSGRHVRTLLGPEGNLNSLTALALSGDGSIALAGSHDHPAVWLWDAAAGRCLRTLSGHSDGVDRVLISPDGRSGVFFGGGEAQRWEWDLPGGFTAAPLLSRPRAPRELGDHGRRARELVAAAEQAIADGGTATALDLLRQARAVPGHERAPQVLAAWRKLGARTRRVGLRGVTPARSWPGAFQGTSLAISGDGRIAAVAGERGEGPIRLYDTADGSLLRRQKVNSVRSLWLSADGEQLAAGSGYLMGVWRTTGGPWLYRLDTRKADGRAADPRSGYGTALQGPASFAYDGRVALGICGDHALRLWDLETGMCLRTLAGHTTLVEMVEASTDMRRALSFDMDGDVRIWDVVNGTCVLLPHPDSWVDSACLSADGDTVLLTGDHRGHTAWLADARTGDFLRGLGDASDDGEDRSGEIPVARLTSDGRFALTAAEDGTVHIWDTSTGRRIHTLEAHADEPYDLALSADDRYLLTGADDGTLRLWELDWELG